MVDFAVLADGRLKFKEKAKRHKYMDLSWEQRELWNVWVTVITIVIDAL